MKNSVIKSIFNGVKGNRQAMVLPKANKDNLRKVSDAYDKLIGGRFNSKQKKEIDKFLQIHDKSYCDEIDLYFVEGFKLGLLIGIECLEDL